MIMVFLSATVLAATAGEISVLCTAASDLWFIACSYKGLTDPLKFEGLPHEQAAYGVPQNGY